MCSDGVSCVEAACIVKGGDKKASHSATIAVLKVLLQEVPSGIAPDVNATTGAPLVDCVASGNDKAAELLLTHGCKVNRAAADGRTPLHAACGKLSKPVIELLLSHRADTSATDKAGNTPRAILERLRAPEALLALLDAPAPDPIAGTGEAC